jgi:UDP-N-acetylglucosamine/UDP-N-acetylgalactosamine diphosphorylase
MSTKVARKAHDLEKVGVLCRESGRLRVIEYTEMPEDLARQKNPDGARTFDAANLAIHLLDVAFVQRVAGHPAGLPIRRAEKAIPCLDAQGRKIEPTAPNAVKLETFVFDVLPMAQNPVLLEVDRAEEFSPVKNATGPDSLETSRGDQIERAARWLEFAGKSISRGADGRPASAIEISPLFAQDRETVRARAHEIPPAPPGTPVYIE